MIVQQSRRIRDADGMARGVAELGVGRFRVGPVAAQDDDVDAEDFASFGSLLAFVERLQSR